MRKFLCRRIFAALLAVILLTGAFPVSAEEYVEYSSGFSLANARASGSADTDLYVCIDGVWTDIGDAKSERGSVKYGNISRNYYYINIEDVAEVFAPYGFDNAGYKTADGVFPYESNGSGYVSGEYLNTKWSDDSKIPLGRNKYNAYAIYYAPAGNVTGNSVRVSGIAAANSFYSISVNCISEEDLALVDYGNAYSADGRQLVFAGDDVSVTVPLGDDYGWMYSGTYGDVSSVDTGNTRTYTFSNVTGAITLNAVADVEVTVVMVGLDGNIMSSEVYVLEAGETLPEEAFDGIDDKYKWYDENGEEITDVNTMAFGKNTTITTRPAEIDSGVQADFYVYIDDNWKKVHSVDVLYGKYDGRYLITAAQLEAAFADYGFSSDSFGSSYRCIGYDDSRYENIWADTTPVEYYGSLALPLSYDITHYNVYYLPNNTETISGQNRDGYDDDNGFHTVTLTDVKTGANVQFVLPDDTVLADWLAGINETVFDGWNYAVGMYEWYTSADLSTVLGAEETAGDVQALMGDQKSFTITMLSADGEVLGIDEKAKNDTLISEWINENSKRVLSDGNTIHHYNWKLLNDTPITNQTLNRDITIVGTKKPVYTVAFIDNAIDSTDRGGSFINSDESYIAVKVLAGDPVPAEFIAKMDSNIRLFENYAFVEWRYAGNDGYLVLDASTPVIADTTVWAAYTQEVYVRFWKDRNMTEQFASVGREDQPIGQLYSGAVPDDDVLIEAAPAQGMRFRYWLDLNTGMVFTIATDQVKNNLDLYPVFERAIFDIVDANGNTLAVLYDGTELNFEAVEIEGLYYEGLQVKKTDSSYTVIPNGTVMTRGYLIDNAIEFSGPVNGRYTIVAEPVYKESRTIVYHTGNQAQFNIFGAEGQDTYTVDVDGHVTLLGVLDIINIVSPIGLALDGWATTENADIAEFAPNEAFDGEDELNQLVSAGGTIHLYPVWAQMDNTVAITFESNYPDGAVDADGNLLSDVSYTVYIKSGSKPTMPTLAKAGVTAPANMSDGELQYSLAGWSVSEDGDMSDDNANVDGTYTELNGTYTEGSQYAHAITQNTTFYAIWINETVDSGIDAYFHIRIDGTLPQEPGQHEQSGYLPGTCGNNNRSWVGKIKNKLNVVNNVEEVEANILSEPSIETILSVLQNSSAFKAVSPDIVNVNAADYGTTWWIDWYACKYACNAHYHVDGRVRFAGQVELNYHPNGGSNVPAGAVYDKDEWVDVNFTQIPIRENFEFIGWDEDPAAKIPDYPANGLDFPTSPNLDEIWMDTDKDLYAIWKPKKITIPMDDDFRGMKYEQTNHGEPTAPMEGRTYQFTIEAVSLPAGALPYAKRTAVSGSDGSFEFERIDVQVPGMYVFEVREVVGDHPVQYDTSVYRLTINIVESDYGLGIGGYSFTRDNKMISVDGNNVDNVVFEFTNRTDVRNIAVRKVWSDGGDQDGIRPDEVIVTLMRRGDSLFSETIALSSTNSWTHTWENLDIKEPYGGEIYEYYVTEEAVDGYTAAYTGDMNSGFVVTNSHEPVLTEIDVMKIWNDNNDAAGYRPDAISYTVTGRTPDDTIVVTRSSGDVVSPWNYLFTALPVYHMGQTIVYTLTESSIPGYAPEIRTVGAGSYIVTNNLETSGITVTKRIDGNAADYDDKFEFVAAVYNNAGEAVTALKAGKGYTVDENGMIHFSLGHEDSVTLEMLPLGGYIVINEDSGSYIAEWSSGGTSVQGGMKYNVAAGAEIVVTNTKQAVIPTGVVLDCVPYIAILFVAAGWLIFGMCRRRKE